MAVKNILREHWPIFILAIFIGFLFIYPHIYLRIIDREYYQGVDVLGSDAETHYVARIREVYDGHFLLGQTYLWEGKDLPYIQPPFAEFFVASLGKVLGLDAIGANIATKFLFGVLLSFVIYFFVYELFGDAFLALASVCLILLGNVLTSIPEIKSFFSFSVQDFQFLKYARPVNPSLSSILMFGYLWSMVRLFKSERPKTVILSVNEGSMPLENGLNNRFFASLRMTKMSFFEFSDGLIAALLLGFSFYIYVYTWTFLFVINGFLVLWFLYRKEWRNITAVFLITFAAMIIAIPYILGAMKASAHPLYQGVFERYGFINGRSLIFSKLGFVGLFLLFLSFLKKLPNATFLLAVFFLAGIAVINQQILTGLKIQNDHYHWYIVTPMASLVIFSTLYFYFKQYASQRLMKFGTVTAILFFIFMGLVIQETSYKFSRDNIVSANRYSPIFQWLDVNTPKDSVVFASPGLSELIPAYTHDNVYYSQFSTLYLIPEERLLHNYFLLLSLRGIKPENAESYLQEHKSDTAAQLFHLKYRYRAGCSSCFPDELNVELAQKFSEFSKVGLINSLKKYRVDYIVQDKAEDGDWALPRGGLEPVFEAKNVAVYKVL